MWQVYARILPAGLQGVIPTHSFFATHPYLEQRTKQNCHASKRPDHVLFNEQVAYPNGPASRQPLLRRVQKDAYRTPAPVLGLRTASYCTENERTPKKPASLTCVEEFCALPDWRQYYRSRSRNPKITPLEGSGRDQRERGSKQLCPEGGAQRVNGLLRGYRAYPKGNDRPQMRGGR